jgi:amidophosphoribosyltransferase
MCGITAIYGYDYVAQDIYDGLITLQHRGQDAAGIVTYDGKFYTRKDFGLVSEVFRTRHMKRLKGYVGVGFTRYSTMGTGDLEEVQPFLGSAPFGLIIAHNGNIFNAAELRKEIFEKDHRLINSDSDGEVLLNIFSKALTRQDADKLGPEQIWRAVESVHERCKGAYSAVGYIAKHGMFAFRDPHGIRPLLFGKRSVGLKDEYIFASESVTLDILGFEIIGDVGAGEAVFIEENSRTVHRKKIAHENHVPCVFEYVYFARPDSILDGISVYKSRIRMGEKLAEKVKKENLDIDVVMPVPDSSRTSAIAVAEKLGIPYSEGLVKNRYIGRTFIMPGQKVRKKSVRYKLNPMPLEIKGKKILLIDDSIVRGNTSKQIVDLVRTAGAEKIYFTSYSPPVISPNLYGIDLATKEELIAANLTVEEIRKFMGADALIYGDLQDMFDSCVAGNPDIKDLDMSCFDGKYKTMDVDEAVLKANAEARIRDKAEKISSAEDSEINSQLNLL